MRAKGKPLSLVIRVVCDLIESKEDVGSVCRLGRRRIGFARDFLHGGAFDRTAWYVSDGRVGSVFVDGAGDWLPSDW